MLININLLNMLYKSDITFSSAGLIGAQHWSIKWWLGTRTITFI